MNYIFEIKDKTGRKIRPTKKQWSHIIRKHPQVADYQEEIIDTLKNPLKITDYDLDENVRYYYKYLKHRISPEKYLLAIEIFKRGRIYNLSIF